MMNRKYSATVAVVFLCLAAGVLSGCREQYPHSFTIGPGMVERTHAKPAEGGYYTNWDPYAVDLEVVPMRQVNPVCTQHVLIATVRDKDGKPLPNRRVEWIIPDGSIGTLVEVDESGWRDSRGHKVTNQYAISHTNNFDHVLDRGNKDPSDDVHLKKGQTWCVITSPIEGTTHVIAYAPGINDWSKHKVFAQKHWLDVAWEFPPSATNKVGTPHRLVTKVTRYSDKTPLAGYQVTYTIVSGPAATLAPGGGKTASVTTDANGLAAVTLNQVRPVEGANAVRVDIVRPAGGGLNMAAMCIATAQARKDWIAPKLAVSKTAPAQALVGDTFRYGIQVSNPATVATESVVLTDKLPDGIEYVSSTPSAAVAADTLSWSLGTLGAGGSKAVAVDVKGQRTGEFVNVAEARAELGLSAQASARTVIGAPALAIEKHAPAETLLCEPIPYVVIVRNTGNAAATNVRLDDDLPPGLVCQGNKTKVTSDIGTLAPGQARQVRFQATAKQRGTYVNKAVATGDRGLRAEASAQTIVRQPSLALTKTAPAQRFIGRPIAYELTVTSNGDAPARNTVLVDAVPAGTTFIEAGNGGSFAAGKVTWNLGDLAVGASKKVTMTVRADAAGTIRNTARATAVCAEATAEATTIVKGIPAILLEVIDLDDPIEVGSQVTYQIVVTNQGSAVGTNISVICTMPAEQEFVSATGPTKEKVDGQEITFGPLESLAPKNTATYRVTVRCRNAGVVQFKVVMSSDQIVEPVQETEATNIYSD